MPIEIVPFTDRQSWLAARAKDVTSTEVSALFNLNPYTTSYELWHRKKSGTIVEIEATERMKWGNRLQDAIAAGIAEDHGWTLRKMDEYLRDPALRMGASFDFEATLPMGAVASMPDSRRVILEIKNVDSLAFKDGWIINDDDTAEAPPHIEIQVQQQLALTGLPRAYIGALVGGNRKILIERKPDENIIAAIKERVAAFWKSIDDGIEPTPNFERDAEFISRLYSYADPGKVITDPTPLIGDLVVKYKDFSATEKEAGEAKQAIKAQILTLIGDAEKVKGETFSISAGMIGPTRVEYDRAGYRDFRAFIKKGKAV